MSELFAETPQEENTNNSQVEATAEASSEVQAEVKQPEAVDPNSLFADQLQQIKSPDGRQKYADVATALQSIPHAQGKIDELSQKINHLEEELKKRQGMDEMLQQLQASKNTQTETPSASGGLDEQMLASLVERQLSEREQMAARNANAAKVRDTLIQQYGEKAEEQFVAKAQQLGVDVNYFTELAMKAPQLVLSHFQGGQSRPEAQPLTNGIRTDAVKPSAPERKGVMRGASTKDVVEQFKAHKPQ